MFTRVLEDGEVDREGLAIGPGTRLLVVCSAGDRALDAVAWGADEVIAVDTVPEQLRLAALRVASAATLGHDDLVALFSVGRRAGARDLYDAVLRPRLAPADRSYWDRWIDIFEIGLHEHHPLGVGLAALGVALRLVGGRELARTIMGSPDATAQGRRYERRLRRRYWNPVSRTVLGSRLLLRGLHRHPGARGRMRDEGFPGTLEARISALAARSLVRENPVWMPVLAGRPVDPRHEVAWLRPDAVERIRTAPARVRLVQGSVVDTVAALPRGGVDAVGLSNVPDWLEPADLDRLWAGLVDLLPPGGRVLVRSALRAAPLPTGAAAASLVLDRAASARLTAAERSGLFATVSLLRRAADGDGAP